MTAMGRTHAALLLLWYLHGAWQPLRAFGCGLISGRKAFQRPMVEGVELLNAIQDVYLDDSITIA